jgi:chromosome segregation ATPase
MNNQDDQRGEKKNDLKCLKEMEENLKLFEMKLKKLENKNNDVDKLAEEIEPSIDVSHIRSNMDNHRVNKHDLQNRFENDNTSHIRELERELNTRNNENKKLREENENLKRVIDSLKRANNELADELDIKDNENSLLIAKLNDKEKEYSLLEKKAVSNDSVLKNIKFDYENLIKNFATLRKQLESMSDKVELLKADNYNLMQENNEMKRKPTRPQTPVSYTNTGIRTVKAHSINTKESNANDDWEFPSEFKPQSVKDEVSTIEIKLSELFKEKNDAENGLLKLPINPRTLNDINKKKALEQSLKEIENNIADYKMRMRHLK